MERTVLEVGTIGAGIAAGVSVYALLQANRDRYALRRTGVDGLAGLIVTQRVRTHTIAFALALTWTFAGLFVIAGWLPDVEPAVVLTPVLIHAVVLTELWTGFRVRELLRAQIGSAERKRTNGGRKA